MPAKRGGNDRASSSECVARSCEGNQAMKKWMLCLTMVAAMGAGVVGCQKQSAETEQAVKEATDAAKDAAEAGAKAVEKAGEAAATAAEDAAKAAAAATEQAADAAADATKNAADAAAEATKNAAEAATAPATP
ncbi:MAG: hypothetical protein K1X74_09055 [Pirellulales bacterium]|nr:hypothetical protein [Pirellulales bacterium]